jgi:hypothetical protein
VIEDHAIPLMIQHTGYGDLGEDFGERAHQVESKLDKRYSAIRDFGKKESVKSKMEVKASLPMVQVKQEEMMAKTKLKDTSSRVVTAKEARQNSKRKRTEERQSVLEVQMPLEGTTLTSIVKRRKLKLAGAI